MFYDMKRDLGVLLDGAMGTMVQKLGSDYLATAGLSDVLNITHPELIAEIHRLYLEAGAEIIETNTFSANSVDLAEYGMAERVAEINMQGARIAREQVDAFMGKYPGRCFSVAGVLGPGSKSSGFSTDVDDPSGRSISFSELEESYYEQAEALMKGGVDCFLVETVYDTLNAKAALHAIERLKNSYGCALHVMVSATVSGDSGRLLCGQTIEAFLISISNFTLYSVGLNCSFGPESLKPYLRELSALVDKIFPEKIKVSVHPNAGLPDLMGEYSQTPEIMAGYIREYLEEGLVDIIGGCCGTTPDHIRCMAEVLGEKRWKMRSDSWIDVAGSLMLSGLDSLMLSGRDSSSEENDSSYGEAGAFFVNVGERTNVAGSRKFLRLIKEKNYTAAVEIARRQVESGAMVLDVNMDDAMLDPVFEMRNFLKRLVSEPDVARLPVMIDSSHWDVQKAALEVLPGKSIVNSISLKEGEAHFVWQACEIAKYGAAVVVMAFDEKGQADTYERRIAICRRAYDLLVGKCGYRPSDIIFDTNVFPVATGMEEHRENALSFFRASAWIRDNLPGVGVSGGVSNVSFAFRGNNRVREAMHSAFLYHGVRHGMTLAIVNSQMLEVYDNIDVKLLEAIEDVLFNRRADATERLVALASEVLDDNSDAGSSPRLSRIGERNLWRKESVEDRLVHSLVKAVSQYLKEDIDESLKAGYSPAEVIEKLLMAGMKEVGELFGSGKMFLPQVIKSARVMKEAVAIVTPLLPTKGDDSGTGEEEVFTSGDNNVRSDSPVILMATVKGDVHDIGKNIVSVVLSCNGYIIDDMGVMVDSSDIVQRVIRVRPDIIGLSGLIAPSLTEMINVVKELEKNGLTIPVLIGGATTSRIHTAVKIAPEYSGPVIHVSDASKAASVVACLFDKNKRKDYIFENDLLYKRLREEYHRRKEEVSYVTSEEAYANRFVADWAGVEVPDYTSPQVLTFKVEELLDDIDWRPYKRLWGVDPGEDIFNLLRSVVFDIKAVYGVFPAFSTDSDTIILSDSKCDDGRKFEVEAPRQLRKKQEGVPNLSLADYVPSKESEFRGAVGAFCIKVVPVGGVQDPLIVESLCHRLVEAASAKLHKLVASYGIRPAPGYPSCPDHKQKQIIFDILDAPKHTGVRLTDTMAMDPVSSVCGYYFFHPQSRYFALNGL